MFLLEHLRGDLERFLGGSNSAALLMQMPNPKEAELASQFIGKGYKFVLSQLTRTLGGNETHSIADQQGHAVSEGFSSGYSSGRGGGSSQRTRSWNRTRNWSQTISQATGTNWSDAASAQRVYEFAVEPRVIQDLPDYALLLVKRDGRGSVVQAVECDPAIVTLPRVTMDPLPMVPLPHPSEAASTAGQLGELTISQPAPLLPHQVTPHHVTGDVLRGFGSNAPVSGQPTSGPPGQHHPPQQGTGWGQQ